MGYVGTSVPDKVEQIFQIARKGRLAALSLVTERYQKGEPVCG